MKYKLIDKNDAAFADAERITSPSSLLSTHRTVVDQTICGKYVWKGLTHRPDFMFAVDLGNANYNDFRLIEV